MVTGSPLHHLRTMQHPRWEDYEYERADPEENTLYWLGDGQTWDEKDENGDSTSMYRVLRSWRDVDWGFCRGVVPQRGVRRQASRYVLAWRLASRHVISDLYLSDIVPKAKASKE